MGDRKQRSSKENDPSEEQEICKKESIPSMLERGMKAVEGNNRRLEQGQKERGNTGKETTSAKDTSGSSKGGADHKK